MPDEHTDLEQVEQDEMQKTIRKLETEVRRIVGRPRNPGTRLTGYGLQNEVLVGEAAAYDPTFESFRETCRRSTDYYLLDRYPLLRESEPTAAEVSTALEAGRVLVAKIREAIRHD
jgi:hypothetical protein